MEGIVLLIWSNEYACNQKKLDTVGMSGDAEGAGRKRRQLLQVLHLLLEIC